MELQIVVGKVAPFLLRRLVSGGRAAAAKTALAATSAEAADAARAASHAREFIRKF